MPDLRSRLNHLAKNNLKYVKQWTSCALVDFSMILMTGEVAQAVALLEALVRLLDESYHHAQKQEETAKLLLARWKLCMPRRRYCCLKMTQSLGLWKGKCRSVVDSGAQMYIDDRL